MNFDHSQQLKKEIQNKTKYAIGNKTQWVLCPFAWGTKHDDCRGSQLLFINYYMDIIIWIFLARFPNHISATGEQKGLATVRWRHRGELRQTPELTPASPIISYKVLLKCPRKIQSDSWLYNISDQCLMLFCFSLPTKQGLIWLREAWCLWREGEDNHHLGISDCRVSEKLHKTAVIIVPLCHQTWLNISWRQWQVLWLKGGTDRGRA